jgi:hypothetical protein
MTALERARGWFIAPPPPTPPTPAAHPTWSTEPPRHRTPSEPTPHEGDLHAHDWFPADGPLAQARAADPRPVDTPADGRLAQARAADPRPVDTPADGRLAQARAADPPAVDTPADGRLAQARAADPRPADTPADGRLVQARAADPRPADTPADGRLAQARAADPLSVAARLADRVGAHDPVGGATHRDAAFVARARAALAGGLPGAGPPAARARAAGPLGGEAHEDAAVATRALSRDPLGGEAAPRGPLADRPRPSATHGAALRGWQPPVAGAPIAAPPVAPSAAITSAAVLGRAGEVEPVAAALALALRLATRAKAAAVAVVGSMPAEAVEAASAGAAARRLGARLEAHGFEVRTRGRLAWVCLDPDDPQLVSAVRRVTLVAAPAVLAITAPRCAAIDEALTGQDLLVIVAADPDGPLARLAAAGLESVPLVTVRPLGRGPSRSLARAGIWSARPLRALLATALETGS